jgi:hypothetical protein
MSSDPAKNYSRMSSEDYFPPPVLAPQEEGDPELNTMLHFIEISSGKEFKRLFYKYGEHLRFTPRFYNLHGATVLIKAVTSNKPDIVKFLLDEGVNINAQDELGNTALHYADRMKNTPMIALLIANGADRNILNKKNLAIRSAVDKNVAALRLPSPNRTSSNGIEMGPIRRPGAGSGISTIPSTSPGTGMKRGGSRRAKGRGRSRARTTKRKQTRKY